MSSNERVFFLKVAMQTREIFRRYDPNFRAYSLDEAYLDLTNFLRSSQRDADAVVKELRDEVKATTGLSCSAGIGPNRREAQRSHIDDCSQVMFRIVSSLQRRTY